MRNNHNSFSTVCNINTVQLCNAYSQLSTRNKQNLDGTIKNEKKKKAANMKNRRRKYSWILHEFMWLSRHGQRIRIAEKQITHVRTNGGPNILCIRIIIGKQKRLTRNRKAKQNARWWRSAIGADNDAHELLHSYSFFSLRSITFTWRVCTVYTSDDWAACIIFVVLFCGFEPRENATKPVNEQRTIVWEK